MLLTQKLQATINLAAHLHRTQLRHDTQKTPYIAHLFSVMLLTSEATKDEAALCAALMHDSLEDVPGYTYEQLVSDCGAEVALIVKGVTETHTNHDGEDKTIRWQMRKKRYLATVADAPLESAYVSCADKVHNLESLVEIFKKEGKSSLLPFMDMKNTLWFHDEVYKVVSGKVGEDNHLIARYKKVLDEARELLSEIV